MEPARREYCGGDPGYAACHDRESGVPVCDGRTLSEFLLLERAQARLSRSTTMSWTAFDMTRSVSRIA